MKLWISTLVAGACMTIGACVLQAQPTDGPGGPGGRIQRRGAADGAAPADRPAPGDRDRHRDRQGPGGPGGPGPDGPRPPGIHFGPLMIALDTNKDGVLSAEEIANAPANLKKLDKNGDGKIDRVELLPPPPRGPQDGQGPQAGKGPQAGQGPRAGAAAQDGARRPPRGDAASDGPRPGPRGPRPDDRRPPVPPATPPTPPATPQE